MGTKKPSRKTVKKGRPPLEAADRKTVMMGVRATEAERDELHAAAEEAGIAFSPWALEVLLRAARGE